MHLESLRLLLERGQLDAALHGVELRLGELPPGPYHAALELDFSRARDRAAEFLVNLHETAREEFEPEVLYARVCAFALNPGMLHADGFAYESAGDRGRLEWLEDWDFETENDPLVLRGEPLKRLREAYDHDGPGAIGAGAGPPGPATLAEHLVVLRVQQLLAQARQAGREQDAPWSRPMLIVSDYERKMPLVLD